ncbi:hypothetical protein Pst134EB_014588 [Puccinia striiformis f. sp. tritici]|nr:hypothetical protein Pst134EB_014588 [Puccinia striiformis f. sp. tritici]
MTMMVFSGCSLRLMFESERSKLSFSRHTHTNLLSRPSSVDRDPYSYSLIYFTHHHHPIRFPPLSTSLSPSLPSPSQTVTLNGLGCLFFLSSFIYLDPSLLPITTFIVPSLSLSLTLPSKS